MYRGISAINLDEKGRIALPTRYREELNAVVITIDIEENCLLLYPQNVWQEIEAKIEALPSFNPITRRVQRLLLGHATELSLDNNGRILLPPILREYASLEKQLMLIGQGKKFEIWDAALWTARRKEWLAAGISSPAELPLELQTIAL